MSGRVLPWVAVGGAAAFLLYLGTRHARAYTSDVDSEAASSDRLRNAAPLQYRPVGVVGERYPGWVRALKGKSGIYVIREKQRDGTTPIVYVGESHSGRLYQTLTRHLQTWRRDKKFWRGQYGGNSSHDPGLTYARDRVTVAARVLPPERAMAEEGRLIARLRPRDNLIGQTDDLADAVPF